MHIKRLPIHESIIRRTTILSAQLNAVNLSQGFPDDDPSPELKELAIEAIKGSCHQYTDPWGAPALRCAIAHKLREFNGVEADPQRHIVVTCGATEAMIVAMEALVERGSEIIAFAPTYENYILQSRVSGLNLKAVELREPDFSFTREHLESACTRRTAALVFCTPCNPTGKVFTRAELLTILDFAADHDLLIFADETYEQFTWSGHRHVSIASLPGAQDRTVSVHSMGKTYSVTGWRVGYLVASEALTEELRKVHDFHTVTAPHPFQIALAKALSLPESFYDRLRSEYFSRKAILCDALQRAGLTYYEPGGAYFLWCDYSAISSEDDVAFQDRLLREYGVAGVPGSVFYPFGAANPKRLRFTFSKSRATMEEAARRLSKLSGG